MYVSWGIAAGLCVVVLVFFDTPRVVLGGGILVEVCIFHAIGIMYITCYWNYARAYWNHYVLFNWSII